MTSESDNSRIPVEELDELKSRSLYRTMPELSGIPGREVYVSGKRVLNFSSNNYLGMAGRAEVIDALCESARRFGVGSTASRLIAGNTEPHRELEAFIARWKDTEAALVFGSGYQANIGVLTTLAGESDLIISDSLNHASIIDGCRLTRARKAVYAHKCLDRLEQCLAPSGYHRKIVITEAVFSMDGDRAPLREIHELCRKYGALLVVDEAHSAGILGPAGRGWAAELGVAPDVQMGTLGKAVGTSGAYITGSKRLIELLVNKARSFIYTTAPSPAVVGATLKALEIVTGPEGDRLREKLIRNTRTFHALLHGPQATDAGQPSHIAPAVIGDSHRTMEISRRCLEQGIFVHGIRYPTVPEGSARLRFTLMSDHEEHDLVRAMAVFADAAAESDEGSA